MSRTVLSLNQNWLYSPQYQEQFKDRAYDPKHFEEITIPHMNKEIPYNYFDERSYQFISCYRKHFTVDAGLKGQTFFVDFEGVMTYAKVYMNGVYLGEHKGGYTPFSFDVTKLIDFNDDNVLVVQVDSTEREDIPPFGNVIDYLTYGGIYREVHLRMVNSIHVHQAFIKTMGVLEVEKSMEIKLLLANQHHQERQLNIISSLIDESHTIIGQKVTECGVKGPLAIERITMDGLRDISLWDLDNPHLYKVRIEIMDGDTLLDQYEDRIGFRSAAFTAQGFLLNGNPIKIVGLNRHQAFPYVGYAMPKRAQEKDADILKYELGLNTVRTSHYPQSKHFLNRCDEIGLMVFEEIPGWQHIGDEAWKAVAVENVREMIERDYNHPSIIIWGVRINESADDHDFYTKTNALAHELDDTRQTGGVRCISHSELLEDVYTMNDFCLGAPAEKRVLRPQQEITGLPQPVPYLVTEYNGHMYPTKRFDQEERLNEHALRHVMVQNAAALDPSKSGAIGWCAFDYNTHYEFGSGDRICYHGVMDMFRISKFAAYAYKSQVSPEKEIVLEPVTRYARGERAIGGVAPLTIFTNCDKVRLEMGGVMIGEYYPSKDRFPGLAHPPIIIERLNEAWGMTFQDSSVTGFLNDREVISREFVRNPVPTTLSMVADDHVLTSGDMDATRIVVALRDQKGNECPYTDEVVTVSLKGPGKVIGPSTFALIGGMRGFWVKTTGDIGAITLSAHSSNLEADEIRIQVE